MGGLIQDVSNLQLELCLQLIDDLAHLGLLGDLNVPARPSVHFEAWLDLGCDRDAGLSHLHTWHGKVHERVLEFVERQLVVLEELEQLDGLEACDGCCCSGEGGHDSTSLEFDSDPVHGCKRVVTSTNISTSMDEVDVEVLVVILLELLDHELLAIVRVHRLSEHLFKSLRRSTRTCRCRVNHD